MRQERQLAVNEQLVKSGVGSNMMILTMCKKVIAEGRESGATSQNLFASNYGEVRDNCYEEGEIPKGPDLIEEEDEVLQHKRDIEEDEDIEYNIQQISKAGDLSPKHTNSLKNGARKGKPVIPLHVKTRSSRDRDSSIDQ
ncbi:hypothetical protein KY289_026911 [Solanum tuberosum]|nr:hypothetical protein KY289_026911 [Solanum tuberosum]